MKFLSDQMLGTLAKWLRIYGFDTYFADYEISDDELLKISKKEKRILLTKDKMLIEKAKKQKLKVIKINSTKLDDQLKEVLKDAKINKKLFLTRCLICNNPLAEIKKESVKGKVPKKVFENNQEFYYCNKCNKIYWKGTHYDKMKKDIKSF